MQQIISVCTLDLDLILKSNSVNKHDGLYMANYPISLNLKDGFVVEDVTVF